MILVTLKAIGGSSSSAKSVANGKNVARDSSNSVSSAARNSWGSVKEKESATTTLRIHGTLDGNMRSARDAVRGRNHVSNSNAREGASGNLKSSKKEKEEASWSTTERTRESHENNTNNANSVARGKREASLNNSNAKGGARSVTKKKRREDANAGETMRRTLETLDSSINNASSVARGKNKASVNNSNAKGGVLRGYFIS